MKLYFHPLSGHAHRVQLFLSLIGAEHKTIQVDLLKGEHKSADFLRLNRFGQIPVLDDNGTIVTDSNAILVYLAKKLGKTSWLPDDPVGASSVQKWLSVAAGEIANGPAKARLITVVGAPYRADEIIPRAHAILTLIDAELAGRTWIVGEAPTIADIALYSYIARAPEGNVDIQDYGNIKKWLSKVETLPGFVPFQRTAVGLSAAQ